jgi:hypothetical protein
MGLPQKSISVVTSFVFSSCDFVDRSFVLKIEFIGALSLLERVSQGLFEQSRVFDPISFTGCAGLSHKRHTNTTKLALHQFHSWRLKLRFGFLNVEGFVGL